jgi:hypothetical protein
MKFTIVLAAIAGYVAAEEDEEKKEDDAPKYVDTVKQMMPMVDAESKTYGSISWFSRQWHEKDSKKNVTEMYY